MRDANYLRAQSRLREVMLISTFSEMQLAGNVPPKLRRTVFWMLNMVAFVTAKHALDLAAQEPEGERIPL